MHRFHLGALASVSMSLFAAFAPAPAVADGLGARTFAIPARTTCDASGRCYETGDSGGRDDDDRPPPRRRYDPDDNERPPPRHRFDSDDDRPPPPRRPHDPDDDD